MRVAATLPELSEGILRISLLLYFVNLDQSDHQTVSLTLLPTEGGGGGDFLSHTTKLSAATPKALSFGSKTFRLLVFTLLAQSEKILSKATGQGGCYSHFSNKRS